MGHAAAITVAIVFVLIAGIAFVASIREWAAWRKQRNFNQRLSRPLPRNRQDDT